MNTRSAIKAGIIGSFNLQDTTQTIAKVFMITLTFLFLYINLFVTHIHPRFTV